MLSWSWKPLKKAGPSGCDNRMDVDKDILMGRSDGGCSYGHLFPRQRTVPSTTKQPTNPNERTVSLGLQLSDVGNVSFFTASH